MESKIPDDLITAYREAEYWIGDGAEAFCVKVGEPSTALEKLFRDRGVSSAAYITAFNPYSRKQSAAENEASHQELVNQMTQRGVPVVHAVSKDTEGKHQEKGLLALGIAHDAAVAVGKQFEQNAIVWAASGAPPELVLLE